MIYGDPYPHMMNDLTDKIGIRTLVLAQMWELKGSDFSQAAIDRAKPGIPPVPTGLLLIGNQSRKSGGVYQTTWTFEGVNGDGKSVTFKDRRASFDYAFEPGFAQVSLKLHSKYQSFVKNLGAYIDTDGTLLFPEQTPNNVSKRGLNGGGKGQSKRNPLFGVEDFLRMEGDYRFRYAELQLPDGIHDGEGYVAAALPGKPPKVEPVNLAGAEPTGRNWLKAPTTWRRRGLVYEIVESYWLSGPGGWPEPIYGNGKGSGSKNSSEQAGGFGTAPGSGFNSF